MDRLRRPAVTAGEAGAHTVGGLERRIWLSSASASLGDGIRLAALPLAVAAITRDPIQVAGLTVAQRAPAVLLALPAGVVLDRVDGLGALARCQRVRMVLLPLLGGAVALTAILPLAPALAAIYVLAAGLASVEVFGDVAAQVVVQLVVATPGLERVNSRIVAGQMLGEEFVGPPAGGWLFGFGRLPAFLAAGATYALSALLLTRRARAVVDTGPGARGGPGDRTPEPRPGEAASDTQGLRATASRLAGEVTEGLRLLLRVRALTVQAVWTSGVNAANGAVGSVFVLYALESLRLDGVAYGAVLTAGGIGGVIGAAAAGVVNRWIPRRVLMVAASLIAAGCTISLGFVASFAAVFALQMTAAFCGVLFSVVARSFRQSVTPARFAGRTTAVYRLLSLGAVPLGAVVGGVVAADQGPPFTIAAAGALMLVVTLAAAPALRRAPATAE